MFYICKKSTRKKDFNFFSLFEIYIYQYLRTSLKKKKMKVCIQYRSTFVVVVLQSRFYHPYLRSGGYSYTALSHRHPKRIVQGTKIKMQKMKEL